MVWPAVIAAGATLLGGLSTNRANAREANTNRQFQERMSNTAHQREVTDLRKAGLNPVLSANSGASTPGGAMARITDPIGPAVSTALAATRMKADLKQMQATFYETQAKEDLTDQLAEESSVRTDKLGLERELVRSQADITAGDAAMFNSDPWVRMIKTVGVEGVAAKKLIDLSPPSVKEFFNVIKKPVKKDNQPYTPTRTRSERRTGRGSPRSSQGKKFYKN